ncbi:P1 family peptidase [Clostridium tetani]|uniref:Peptidase S58 family protein n=1 Tax=Clostridium tetani TaxID=1513 RepID=A0ABY0ER33_CLOTA|nr:P1 family peptidase [Clostridium tetani]KHO39710.1 peptidase [Clostridium tetani]RXI54255.1 peptidase S58 family protein [Clostridium tetani]RXI68917.1 peptidase S58 family protein [Clostridium tetani]CDI48938.1 peptidase, T4 family [Clostridium tetani 12124569]
MKEISISSIEGIKIGHAEDLKAATGCTVIICKEGGSGGVDIRGGSPGTRETDLLNPINLVDKVHGIVLSGGSAFGLDASTGVMEYLEEKNIGFETSFGKVPIVCSAVLYDLDIGMSNIRPNKAMGYAACLNSEKSYENSQGNVGAGTGATVGKILGPNNAMKGGLGSYALQVGDFKIGAIVAVNCLGDVIDPNSGKILAGAINDRSFLNTENILISSYNKDRNIFMGNTTIGAIVTNGILTKSQCTKVSSMAHNAYGKTMNPAHSMFDGDTIFTLGTNKVTCDVNTAGMLAVKVMERAVLNGIKNAKSHYEYISYSDLV